MYRFIVRTIIFIFVMSLSLYIGAHWKLSEDLKYIKKQLSPMTQFDYENSSLTLDGKVVVSGINLYFRAQDINVTVNRIKFSSGSIFRMAFLRDIFDEDFSSSDFYLNIDGAVIPLTPSLVKYISETEQPSILDNLEASACGSVKRIGFKEYFSMGYDYVVFSTEGRFHQDSYNGNLLGHGWLDIEETSKIDYQIDIANVFAEQDKLSPNLEAGNLEKLKLRIEDKGFNRHKNEFCGIKSNQTAEQFIEKHVKEIAQHLAAAGIKMTPSGKRIYKEFIQPSSIVELSIQPESSFSFNDFGYYDEKELRSLLGLSFTVNGQTTEQIFNGWSLDKFNQIDTRAGKVQEEPITNKRYELITIKRSFELEDVSKANLFIDQEVKAVRDDGKEYVGKLRRIENEKLYIAMAIQGGVVQASLDRSRVASFYVYR